MKLNQLFGRSPIYFAAMVLLTQLTAGQGKSMPDEMTEASALSYQQTAESPTFEAEEKGLRFRLVAAGQERTLRLHGAYRLGQPYHHLYGGQLLSAIRIVAISRESGLIYEGAPAHPDANPLGPSMPPEDQPQVRPNEIPLNSVSGFFNVDLRKRLGLPATAAEYYVFLWLDDIVTPIQTAHVPEGKVDVGVTLHQAAEVKTAPDPEGPEPVAGKLTLRYSKDKAQHRVSIALPAEVLSKPSTDDQTKLWLTTFVFGHRSREFAWQSRRLSSLLKIHAEGRFSFDLFGSVKYSENKQKVFVLATLGPLQSDILVVPRESL